MPLSRKLMQQPRLSMSLTDLGVRGVYYLGRYNNTLALPSLPDHIHRGAIEICFLVKGFQSYRVKNQSFDLKGGDVFITFPNERHSTGGAPEEKGVLYWLILSIPKKGDSFLGLSPVQSKILGKTLLDLKSRHFRGSPEMKEHLDTITQLCQRPGNRLRPTALANQVIAFLLEVILSADREMKQDTGRKLSPVLSYIEEHNEEALNVPFLASLARLSISRFKTRFKLETGMPPAEYVLRTKVRHAQRLLAHTGRSITEIAYDLGFSSSQYFATVFKRFTGLKPGQWREKKGS